MLPLTVTCPPLWTLSVPVPLTASMPVDPAASPRETSSVTLTVPPVWLKAAVWPDASPIWRPNAVRGDVCGWVRARVPPVTAVVPAASCKLFSVPPPARVSDPADVLTRLFDPPLSAPAKVKPPVPVPATVAVAASVADWDSAMLPAPATVTVGLVPVRLSGLPARVTVPALLLTVRALRSNGVPGAPMSLVAVYDDDCVAAVPKVRVA